MWWIVEHSEEAQRPKRCVFTTENSKITNNENQLTYVVDRQLVRKIPSCHDFLRLILCEGMESTPSLWFLLRRVIRWLLKRLKWMGELEWKD